jgi:hypothetical protein
MAFPRHAFKHPPLPCGFLQSTYHTAMPIVPQRGLRPFTKWMLLLLALSPLALAVPQLLEDSEAALPSPAPLEARQPGTRLTIHQIRPVTGMAINAHRIDDLPLYLQSVDRIADLGANALIVFTPMFQKTVQSDDIRFIPEKCAADDHLIAIFRKARTRGLHTTLVPVVLIESPSEKEWRGVIKPADWDAWWISYNAFVDRFLAIANAGEVDLLAVGSELNSTEDQIDRWKAIVEKVRSSFSGQLTYSANWDRYEKIDLWPLVDVMCVSSYFELERDDPNATVSQLTRAWSPFRRQLLSFARKAERPLLLSEVGYPTLPWAHQHPWNYVNKDGVTADTAAQAKCWQAFFRAWTDEFTDTDADNPAAGFFAYHWDPYHHGQSWDIGYGIDGKPSYEIVRNGIARIHGVPPES